MSDCDYRGVTLDQFRRCMVDGCEVEVLAPLGLPVACKAHGGNPELPQFHEPDPFGYPVLAAADSSPAAVEP